MQALTEIRKTTEAESPALESFADLVKGHQSMVFSIAYHFLHDRAAAEEVAQDVFLALHGALNSIESPAHAVNWLRRVAAHRSIDKQRRDKQHRSRMLFALDEIREPAAPAQEGDPMLADSLRQLVATLPEHPRMVMILRYQEDMDVTDIAAALEMPAGTVKSHIQRSLKLLRDKLTRRLGAV